MILILSAVFPPEPVVSAILSNDIANSLSVNNEVTVLSPKPSRPYGFKFVDEPVKFNFQHIQAKSYTCPSSKIFGRFKESYSFGKHCQKYISENHQNIEVIYANTWPLFGQYFAVKAAKKFNIPIIVHVQDIYPESFGNKIPILSTLFNFFLLPLDKHILRNANKIIAISSKMKNYLSKSREVEKDKINVIQNWQDEASFIENRTSSTSNSAQNNVFTFMYLGNIGPVAGIDLLIDAFAKVDLPNCRLIIAGSGSMKVPLQKMATEAKLKSVEFWDVPAGKVPEIQEKAGVMILPIKKGAAMSSIPSKLPAYMFSAKPIIACVDKGSDTANVIEQAGCGWILPPEDKPILIETMKMAIGLSRKELQQKGMNGFDFAIEHFSKGKNLKKLCNIITETMPA